MAKKGKGYSKEGLDISNWEFFRGFGRQLGRSLAKGTERKIKKVVLDDQSKLRKAIDRFEITGTLKGTLNKLYKIIDLFDEEYNIKNNPAFLQSAIYLKDDIRVIDDKIKNSERLIFTEAEERAYQRCIEFWEDVKIKIENQ